MRVPRLAAAAAAAAGLVATTAVAGSLEVSPTLVDIAADVSSASSFRLRNRSDAPATVQVRVFRWRQENGADVLEPTTAIAVSPPFATLRPSLDYAVRVVRPGTASVTAEESYRVLVDELPAAEAPVGSINLAVRHSIPVFIHPRAIRPAELRWSARLQDGYHVLALGNAGGRRVRVAALRATDVTGLSVNFGAGLAGYALAGAGRSWTASAPSPDFDVRGARVAYVTELGPETRQAGPDALAR